MKRITLDIRGRLRVTDTNGNPVDIVIQLAGKGYGNGRIVGNRQYLIRRHVPHPRDPKTAAQLERRARFQAAVEAWKSLSMEERKAIDSKARATGRTGWNLWLSRQLSK